MIKTYYINLNDEIKETTFPSEVQEKYKWIWVDMNESTEEETNVLAQYFDFHPLSIEDATLVQQRDRKSVV